MEKLDTIVHEALESFAVIDDAAQLEHAKARYLGTVSYTHLTLPTILRV